MMEKDDKLLFDYFAQNKQEIEDNGFSAKVMKKVSKSRAHIYSQVWVSICSAMGIILFLVFDGAKIIFDFMKGIISESIVQLSQVHISTKTALILAFATLILVAWQTVSYCNEE